MRILKAHTVIETSTKQFMSIAQCFRKSIIKHSRTILFNTLNIFKLFSLFLYSSLMYYILTTAALPSCPLPLPLPFPQIHCSSSSFGKEQLPWESLNRCGSHL